LITGPKALDEKLPLWYKCIDIDKLDLTSSYNCVLGQIYGVFSVGWKELKFYETKTERISELGFLGAKPTDLKEWIDAINKRNKNSDNRP